MVKSTYCSIVSGSPVTIASTASCLFFGLSLLWWSNDSLWTCNWSCGRYRRRVASSGAAWMPNSLMNFPLSSA